MIRTHEQSQQISNGDQIRTKLLGKALCCPTCHGELMEDSCVSCGRPLIRIGDQVRFVNASINTADAVFQSETQNSASIKARIFNVGRSIISSEFQPRNHLKHFLDSAHGTTIELGSGSRRLSQDIVNIDLFPSLNVDIVADISETPLKDECADFVIIDSVIEHVSDPIIVIAEAKRILKPGGKLFINCPFLLPYHGYPAHYQNFTRDGLQHLLRDFKCISIMPTMGPMSALVNMIAETFAILVGGERGSSYVAAKGLALLPIFWLKYLDALFTKFERSHRISGLLCAIAEKT